MERRQLVARHGRVRGLERPADEGREPAGAVLQVAQVDQVLDPLLERLHVAEHHGGRGLHAQAVGRLHDREPVRRGPLGDPDDLPHAVGQDLGAAPGDGVQARGHQPAQGLVGRQRRDLLDVLDLGGREAVDPDRVAALDPAEQLLVVLDPQVRVQPALEQDLVPAQGQRLLDLGRELLLGQQVPLARRQVAVERAEGALGDADVRVVDVAVDDVGDDALRMEPLAHGVGEQAQLQQVGLAEERDPLLPGEPLARQDLLLDPLSHRHRTSARVPAR